MSCNKGTSISVNHIVGKTARMENAAIMQANILQATFDVVNAIKIANNKCDNCGSTATLSSNQYDVLVTSSGKTKLA